MGISRSAILLALSLTGACALLPSGSADLPPTRGSLDDKPARLEEMQIGTQDEHPVEMVQLYWSLSSVGDLSRVKELIVPAPPSFENAEERCGVASIREAIRGGVTQPPVRDRKDEEVTAVATADPSGWMFNSLTKLSEEVAERRISAESVKLVSALNNEAIVSVSYLDPNLPGRAVVFHYLFLYRKDGRWSVFMAVRDPIFHNPNYARQNCERGTAQF